MNSSEMIPRSEFKQENPVEFLFVLPRDVHVKEVKHTSEDRKITANLIVNLEKFNDRRVSFNQTYEKCLQCDVILNSKSMNTHLKSCRNSPTPAQNYRRKNYFYWRNVPSYQRNRQKRETIVNCQVCDKAIVSHRLKRHLRTHSKAGYFECDFCGLKFLDKVPLKKNLKRCLKKKVKSMAERRKNLQKEQSKERQTSDTVITAQENIKNVNSQEKYFLCEVCGETFLSKKLLDIHGDEHCEEDFQVWSKLLVELRKDEKNDFEASTDMSGPAEQARLHKCETCLLSYTTESSLKRHQKIHQHGQSLKSISASESECEQNNFVCQFCSSTFSSKYTLRDHIGLHFKLKCGICYKMVNKYKITQHLMMHDESFRMKCDLCSKTFSSRGNLKQHFVLAHPRGKFCCTMGCHKKFTNIDVLLYHEKIHFKTGHYRCPVCGEITDRCKDLSEHIRISHKPSRMIFRHLRKLQINVRLMRKLKDVYFY